jgi:hypothetical protein
LLWILILTSDIQFKNFLNDLKSSKLFPTVLILFIAFHGTSLIYSVNFTYGLSKFYGILFNLLLNILALRFIIVNFSPDIFKKLVEVILFAGAGLTFISILAGPFTSFYDEYLQMKIWGINLWSHVGYGRFMGLVFIVSLINITYLNFLKKFHLDKIFLILSFAGLMLSGLRSAIICSMFISAVIFFYSIRRKNISLLKISGFLAGGMMLLVIAAYFNDSLSILLSRFTQVFNVFHQENLSDGAISTRLHIYKNSFDLFLQNIYIGRGLGSYYDESLFLYTRGLKYPHNIFIEYGIELGILGVIFIATMLAYIYKSVFKVNTILSFVFLYFVLLSMFSYSIPFQTGMFSFLAFIALKDENIRLVRNTYQFPAY